MSVRSSEASGLCNGGVTALVDHLDRELVEPGADIKKDRPQPVG